MLQPKSSWSLIAKCAPIGIALAGFVQAADWDTDVHPVEVARFPTYTEGVVVDHEGNLYVSHADRISKIAAQGKVSLWGKTPSPNGHKVLANGTHLVCDRKGTVYQISSQGQILRSLASLEHGANDICLDTPNGGYYFTSPYASQTEPKGKVYYVDKLGEVHVVADKLGYPNGIVLRPGGEILLVGESLYNRILEFPVNSPGKVGTHRVFANLPAKGESQPAAKPDGMALDEMGNLFVAHYGMGRVQVLDRQGKLLASLPGAGVFTSNVAFGGADRNRLYVTGSIGPTEQTAGMLVRLDLPWVKGLRILPPAR